MDDDFNEQFDEIFGGEGDTPDLTPTWRATIRRGRLMLTGWAPWLITGGPMGNLLPARARSGVTIADLTVHCEDRDEVSVRYLVRAEPRLRARGDPRSTGRSRSAIERIWLPDSHGRARARPRADHRRDGPLRRTAARGGRTGRRSSGSASVEAKAFPKWCPICGCEMPQWTARPARRDADARPHKGSRWAASDSRRRERQEKT